MRNRREGLADLRKRRGFTQEGLASAIGCSAAAVISWESGRNTPRFKYRQKLAAQLGITTGQLEQLLDPESAPVIISHVVPGWLGHYASLVLGCGRVDEVEFVAIPGLLQTEAYTRAAELVSGRPLTEADLQIAVNQRQTRQRVLFRHPDPLQLTVILSEGVLRDVVGSHEIMAEQLEHLLQLAELPNIDIRLIGPGMAPCAISGFQVLSRAGESNPFMVCTADIFGARYHEHPKAVEEFMAIHRRLLETALSSRETVNRIRYILESVHR